MRPPQVRYGQIAECPERIGKRIAAVDKNRRTQDHQARAIPATGRGRTLPRVTTSSYPVFL